jgi:hypothetical protein
MNINNINNNNNNNNKIVLAYLFDRYIAKEYPSSRSPGSIFTYWEHKDHFRGLGASPVGLANDVSAKEGFFMPRFEDYMTVTLFDGCLDPKDHLWSFSEAHRANRNWTLHSKSSLPCSA